MNSRIEKQMKFLLEIDKLKNITRQTYISDASRKENDSEHSWHLAVMSMLLSEYANEPVDVLRVMSMTLIHDIIEIDAGDTYAYDDAANITKRERELQAAERLFSILPFDQAQYMRGLWDEFEEGKTPEAKFAGMLDHIQPIMLNNASGGISWREHNVKESQILHRNKKTKEGSRTLWDYAYQRYIIPNVFSSNIQYDYENIDFERYSLACGRIKEIYDGDMNIPKKYTGFFKEIAGAFLAYSEQIRWVLGNNYAYGAPIYVWYKEIPLEKWEEMNNNVLKYRYDSGYYKDSYANPSKAVIEFGENLGHILSAVAGECLSLGPLCFEARFFEIVTCAELFLEIYNIFENYEPDEYEGAVKSALYYHIYDYMDEYYEYRVRDTITRESTFFTDIINNIDMSDERSLYITGEHITFNETESFKYINSLTDEDIDKIARAYTDGYITSFQLAGIDLSKKETVQIRYPVGFERIVKRSMELFAESGLKTVIARNYTAISFLASSQSGSIDSNPQFAYDHRYDKAIYLNKAMKDRQLSSLKNAYEKYKNEALVYAGPAVIEYFGEKNFTPVTKKEALSLNDEQRILSSSYDIEASQIINNYINRENYSFTIIAFPVPSIGEDYEKIFKDTIRINTLDTKEYEIIQQKIIDVLDGCSHVHIKGYEDNHTNIVINLAKLDEPDRQTRFHNCLADCNIPVGEVYTSPVLAGTGGLLHVKNVYINRLFYKNLSIKFEDGKTTEYNCSNYNNDEDNKAFIRDNLLRQHVSLPMGEFAIGTNTAAFNMGKKYGISRKLPILIAEKTGPHIAVGDTCFCMSEDVNVYNPDKKEVIAKDNEVSKNRYTDPGKAYFGCHTDITIPYDEIGFICAVGYDGSRTMIIENGKFVLKGTEKLNKYL